MPDDQFAQLGSIELLIGGDLFYKMLQTTSEKATVPEYLANEGCEWKFIQPHGPHLGVLWEAAMKST